MYQEIPHSHFPLLWDLLSFELINNIKFESLYCTVFVFMTMIVNGFPMKMKKGGIVGLDADFSTVLVCLLAKLASGN